MSDHATVLPAWMYRDPADVAERKEQSEINKETRKAARAAELEEAMRAGMRMIKEHRGRFGNVSAGTVRKINQARIREAMKGKR